MSGVKPGPNMGRRTAQGKQPRIQKGLALTRVYLLSSSVVPATLSAPPGIWESSKLPSLTNIEHEKTPGSRRIIEPAWFIPGQRPLCETFHHKFCPPSFQKPTSPLPCGRAHTTQPACAPVYAHFSLPIRPLPRLNHVARPARSLGNSQRGLRPSVKEPPSPERPVEDLSIKGIPCFSKALPTKGPKQLHVFLPTEGTAEEEDKDSESIDEGFLDEVDHKAVPKQPGETERLA